MAQWDLPPKEGHMDKPDGIYFQNITGKDLQERLKKDDIILIPTGATENHGPHSPYGEDGFIPTRIAELVAQRTGCTVAQPIWYGSHPQHHLGMPGTIVIPENVYVDYLRAVIAGFWNTGFRKQIFVNLHAQGWVIPDAIHGFGKRYQVPAIIVAVTILQVAPSCAMLKQDGGVLETPWTHADEGETSLALNLHPEFINMEDAIDSPASHNLPGGHFDVPGLGYKRPVPWFAQMGNVGLEVLLHPGVVGHATKADASKMKSGVEQILDYLVKLHDDILKAYPPGKLPDKMSMRSDDEIEAVLKGPFKKGGKHLFTIAYPP